MEYTANDYKKGQPRWCPGCGDHFFLASLHKAMAEIGVAPENIAVISGIDAHLTVDNCYLVIDDSKTTITDTPDETPTAIETVKTVNAGSAVRYNMAGQQVGKDYKGLVIENGRKFLNK